MALTPEAGRAAKILDARVAQCIETLCEVFGTVTCEVMFTAVARWFGMVIFNLYPTPEERRETAKKFADQIEAVVTKHERGVKG